MTTTALWTCTSLVLWSFASRAAEGEDVSYPPPPGAYRSEPSVWSSMPYSPGTERQAGSDDTPVTPSAGSSSMLPLPDNGYDGRPGSYNANTLFGSKRPAERASPMFVEPLQQPQAEQQPSRQLSPAPYPTVPPPERNDFSVDFRRNSQRPAVANSFQPPEGRAYQGYSAYAPAYPAYRQYPAPYQSGQMMGHAPAPPAQAYPDYPAGDYAAGYPQSDAGMPPQGYYPAGDPVAAPEFAPDGYDTSVYPQAQDPVPAAMAYPDTTDSAVFRPTD